MGLCAAIVVAGLIAQAALGAGVRSVGLRFILPIGNVPGLLGLEVSGDFSLGIATGSLFVSARGNALLTISYDLQMGSDDAAARTFLRLTTGLVYFDRTRALPRVLYGGGLTFEVSVTPTLALAAAGEFLYPLAFPIPMVSASGRWVLP
jgi:hypothetical protein